MTSIPSSLCTLSAPPVRKSPAEVRERRLREQGYDVTTCPTCGQTATRETCMVTRDGRTMRQVVLRCWGKADAALVPGSARCAPVVSDPRECHRCGSPLEVGAHPRRKYCRACKELLKGLAGPQRDRVLASDEPLPEPTECPCGCGRFVRPGNVFVSHGCAQRMRRRKSEPSARPRPYTCHGCGKEEVHEGRGYTPRFCYACNLKHRAERKRARRTFKVRSSSCADCGAEISQEGRGGMPRRCRSCATARIAEQNRVSALRRYHARRRSA